jgi:hypothetical protein
MKENEVADNWREGLHHIYRVWEYLNILFEKFPRLCKHEDLTTILQVFVLMHDIEKGSPAPDHAVAAVKYLRKLNLEIKGLSAEDMETVYFIIENHNKGLEHLGIRRAKQKKHILLGIAALVNHMDYLGLYGHYRTLDAVGKGSDIFGNISDEIITKILDRSIEYEEVKRLGFGKQNIAFTRLVFDWCLTDAIVTPIVRVLPMPFKYIVFRIGLGSERRIREIIRLKEEDEAIEKRFLDLLITER